MLRKYNKDKSNKVLQQQFRKSRNKVQIEVEKAKSEYILNKAGANKEDPKKMWKLFKNIGYSEKSKGCAKL